MRFLTLVSHSDYVSDFNYAYIEITPDLAKTILSLRKELDKLHEKYPDMYCLKLWDASPVFFSHLESEELSKALNEEGYTILDEDFEVPEGERTCVEMMVISGDPMSTIVYWTAIPEYVDGPMVVETEAIPYTVIERCL